MNPNIKKALLGAVTAAAAAAVISKVLKETNTSGFSEILKNMTKDVKIDINLDALTPKEEKVINPNGEDYTVVPEYVRIDDTYDAGGKSTKASTFDNELF